MCSVIAVDSVMATRWDLLSFVAVGLLLNIGISSAYPNGAGPDACTDMVPQHGYSSQTGSSPYVVILSSATYKPNSTVQVTIVSLNSAYFKGFLIMALPANGAGSSTPVGSFVTTESITHALCSDASSGGAALTHSEASQKNNITLIWNAPPSPQGNLIFYVTIVKSFDTYWSHHALANISGMTPVVSSTSPMTTHRTTTPSPGSLNVSIATCGKDKSCIYSPRGCTDSSCDFILTWRLLMPSAAATTAIRFEMRAKSQGWAAVGFSKSTGMNGDSIVACVRTDTGAVLQQLYSTGEFPPQPMDVPSNVVNTTVQTDASTVTCIFVWNNDAAALKSSEQFNLSDSYYVILAKGPADADGNIGQHVVAPLVSEKMLVMTLNSYIVFGAAEDNVSWLLKMHGALMVVAWMLCGGTSIILARYYKKSWLDQKHCGEKVWFAWHRAGLIITLVFTVTAVVLVFVEVGGWSQREGLPQGAHPFIGIVATGFCVINPIMAALRCSPGSKDRYIFNWAHWFIGTASLILAGAAILIGVQFDGMAPSWLLYVAAGYVAFYGVTYFTLWLYDIVPARSEESQSLIQDSYPMKEEPSCGCSFKCATFAVFFFVTVAVTTFIAYVLLAHSASSASSAT